MTCDLKCECGRLNGIATITTKNKFKPMLAYRLVGEFVIQKSEPRCVECLRPALTTGEWRTEENHENH